MIVTDEMIMFVKNEIKLISDEMLEIYNITYKKLNAEYPNSFYEYRIKCSDEELISRGIKNSF